MPEYTCDVTVNKTYTGVKVTADSEEKVEENAAAMSEEELALQDPSPAEDVDVDNIECVEDCEEEEAE